MERRDLATEETMGPRRPRQPANTYVEPRWARAITRKEAEVSREASRPTSWSGTHRRRLGGRVVRVVARSGENKPSMNKLRWT